MKVLLQRVKFAKVEVSQNVVGEIGTGLLLFLGFKKGDSEIEIHQLVDKIANARIFGDEQGKMNLNVRQVGGDVLVVSQFTLCANLKKGNRPSFIEAAAPQIAKQLYQYFCESLSLKLKKEVQKGVFGADMQVHLLNDGPVTLMYEIDNQKLWN